MIVPQSAREAATYVSGIKAPNEKPSNPKDSVGIKKVPMSAVSGPVLMELGLAMLEGALKYGRHNYRTVGVRASVYYDAALRHLMAWWEGEDIDPDSGLSHLVKAIACLVVIRDSMIRGNWSDDRPPKVEDGWIAKLNEHAARMIEAVPNPKEAHQERLINAGEMSTDPRKWIPVHAVGDKT